MFVNGAVTTPTAIQPGSASTLSGSDGSTAANARDAAFSQLLTRNPNPVVTCLTRVDAKSPLASREAKAKSEADEQEIAIHPRIQKPGATTQRTYSTTHRLKRGIATAPQSFSTAFQRSRRTRKNPGAKPHSVKMSRLCAKWRKSLDPCNNAQSE